MRSGVYRGTLVLLEFPGIETEVLAMFAYEYSFSELVRAMEFALVDCKTRWPRFSFRLIQLFCFPGWSAATLAIAGFVLERCRFCVSDDCVVSVRGIGSG